MDTSVEYIMMCQRSTDLQSSWKPSKGDFFTTAHSYCGDCHDECMCEDCARMANIYVISGQYDYHESIGGTHWFYGGHACVRDGGNFADSTACYTMTKDGSSGIYDRFTNGSCEEKVWLPRQDQLQEMFWDGITKQAKLREFIGYLDNQAEYNPYYDSLESLWLRLFIREKHNKKWNRISNIRRWELIKNK